MSGPTSDTTPHSSGCMRSAADDVQSSGVLIPAVPSASVLCTTGKGDGTMVTTPDAVRSWAAVMVVPGCAQSSVFRTTNGMALATAGNTV